MFDVSRRARAGKGIRERPCRSAIWIPFINKDLGASPECVVVGHSSGAVAALRLAERQKLKGIIIVAGYDSDMGQGLVDVARHVIAKHFEPSFVE